MTDSLKDLRKQSKKTLAEVADVLGVTAAAVSNYESGMRTLNIMYVVPLSLLYGVAVEEIIDAQYRSLNIGKPDKIV